MYNVHTGTNIFMLSETGKEANWGDEGDENKTYDSVKYLD